MSAYIDGICDLGAKLYHIFITLFNLLIVCLGAGSKVSKHKLKNFCAIEITILAFNLRKNQRSTLICWLKHVEENGNRFSQKIKCIQFKYIQQQKQT